MDFGEHFSNQVDREKFKDNLLAMLEIQMQRVYKSCTKTCLKSFEEYRLSTEERKCLTQCYGTRVEAQQVFLDSLVSKIKDKIQEDIEQLP